MACDCKANRQIYELGKRYGSTVNASRKDILKSGIWKTIQYLFLGVFAVLAAPVLFCILIYKANVKGEKVVHIGKFVGLNRKQDVRV